MKSITSLIGALTVGCLWGAVAHAQASAAAFTAVAPPDAPLHVVSYYEVLPVDRAPAAGKRPKDIFATYVDEARQEPGALSFDVLHDVEKRNRYVVVEVWRNDAAFQQHRSADSSHQLAQALQPWLLGPSDQLVNVELQ